MLPITPTISDKNILINEINVWSKNPCNDTAPTELRAEITIIGMR